MPNSASRIMTGLLVPHFISRNCLVFTKYTSHLKGLLKPYFQDFSAVRTGILLVCIGKATKQVDALQAERKEYVAELMLGATTPSYDMEHPIDQRYPTEHISREMIEKALADLTGERLQAPPIYSAKKVEGVRAYEFARAGEQVELKKALINIYEMEILDLQMPYLKIRVRCSKGTYIRSLAHEIGEAVQSGAYLRSLRRTRSGGFTAENGWNLQDFLEKLTESETK